MAPSAGPSGSKSRTTTRIAPIEVIAYLWQVPKGFFPSFLRVPASFHVNCWMFWLHSKYEPVTPPP